MKTAASTQGLPAERTLKSVDDLLEAGFIGPGSRSELDEVGRRYSVALTPAMARLIDPADPADPIARQFLPDKRELVTAPEERADPIGDDAHSPVEGIVHRYPDRVLLKLVHTCAVYCRFCFRRETVGPGGSGMLSPEALQAALAYIRRTPDIWEVVVTGGDPLMLSPRRIHDVVTEIGAITHVKVMRWHTRIPVVAPERITDAVCAALTSSGLTVYVAVHANHPRELTAEARAACDRLLRAGVSLVSQTVLLKGVNDHVDTLAALMRAFVEARIKPYYLHHADLAPGTAHWRTSIDEGRRLVAALRGRVSGLCQPHYVLDIPGGFGKAPISADHLTTDGAAVFDRHGVAHAYPSAGQT